MTSKQTSPDLVIRDGLILPMDRDHHWFRGSIVVRNGRIEEVCEGDEQSWGDTRVLDAGGCAVLPGFVQVHVHVVQSLLRHQADGLSLLDWLQRRTWPYEASLDGDGVEAAAELGIAELLCGGTTTALDFGTTHDHDRVFQAAERLGIRLVSGKTHMDIGDDAPPALLEDRDRSLADAEALGKRWHGAAGGRLRYAVAPRFALSCSAELLRGCSELAREHGWLLQTHAAENRTEVEEVRRLTGRDNILARRPCQNLFRYRHTHNYSSTFVSSAPLRSVVTIRLIASTYALALASIISVDTPLPVNVRSSFRIRTVASPSASFPSVTARIE